MRGDANMKLWKWLMGNTLERIARVLAYDD